MLPASKSNHRLLSSNYNKKSTPPCILESMQSLNRHLNWQSLRSMHTFFSDEKTRAHSGTPTTCWWNQASWIFHQQQQHFQHTITSSTINTGGKFHYPHWIAMSKPNKVSEGKYARLYINDVIKSVATIKRKWFYRCNFPNVSCEMLESLPLTDPYAIKSMGVSTFYLTYTMYIQLSCELNKISWNCILYNKLDWWKI